MNSVFDKVHIDLGSTRAKQTKCGEFVPNKFITYVDSSATCGCTTLKFKDNKLIFCISNSGKNPTIRGNYYKKEVSINVDYLVDGVRQQERLTASVDVENR